MENRVGRELVGQEAHQVVLDVPLGKRRAHETPDVDG